MRLIYTFFTTKKNIYGNTTRCKNTQDIDDILPFKYGYQKPTTSN